MKKYALACLLYLTTIQYANAIIIRHDVDDSQYQALGEQYAASVGYVGGCAATLIDPQWLLTAAHCVERDKTTLMTARHLNHSYRIETIFVHPQFNLNQDEIYDIALVQLKTPVVNGTPATLYQKFDEVGKPVIFVGRGTFGNGKEGLIRDDYVQRGATNTVVNADQQVIGFRFDEPEKATPLEGISSRGDSGGPAFIETNDTLAVIGVSSYQVSNNLKEGHYGVGEYYTRVASFYSWLNTTMAQAPAPKLAQHPLIDAIVADKSVDTFLAEDKDLLKNNAVINEALYQSVVHNRIKQAQQLINHHADISAFSIKGRSLFDFVLLQQNNGYFTMLTQTLANNKALGDLLSNTLPYVIENYRKSPELSAMVEYVISHGGNIDAKTPAGDTALILAGWLTNDIKLVKRLIKHGADLNIPNNNGDTPTMDAAYLGKTDILAVLLENGADATLRNKRGHTALDLATHKKHQEAIDLLNQALSN